jgi:hypothetical protein
MSKALFKNINEAKNKFKITDFPEGAKILINEVNERNTKLYVYPSSKKDHQMISNWLERSPFHAEEDSNSFMFSVSGQRDADATERDLDKEFTKLGANASFVLEGRSQIKRKYGEHGAIRVNSEAPVRNSILEFVGKRFVTRAELDSHLTQLSEDRGKAVDQNAWFKRNERYFESFSNRGSEVWTLSKYGKRVLENIIKSKQEKQEKGMIKESIGLFKFDTINEAIDVKYWADYNDDTSGQGKKEDAEKSNKFNKDFFNKAMNSWNSEAESGSGIRAFSSEYSKIYKMAEEFFKKAGYISTNIIHAMIMQYSWYF